MDDFVFEPFDLDTDSTNERLRLYDDLQEFLYAFDFSSTENPTATATDCPCSMLEGDNLFAQECTPVGNVVAKTVANSDLGFVEDNKQDPPVAAAAEAFTITESGNKRKDAGMEVEIHQQYYRPRKMLKVSDIFDFPTLLSRAFNEGNMNSVSELIRDYTTTDCALRTHALDEDLHGADNIIRLFQSLYEECPDSIMLVKGTKFCGEGMPSSRLCCRIYLTGTRRSHSAPHYSYLYNKPTWSLMDNTDTSRCTEIQRQDMERLSAYLKSTDSPYQVFGKGGMKLNINDDYQITRFFTNWKLMSFQEVSEPANQDGGGGDSKK